MQTNVPHIHILLPQLKIIQEMLGGITPYAIAKLIGLSPASVWRWYRGTHKCTGESAYKLLALIREQHGEIGLKKAAGDLYDVVKGIDLRGV